MVARFWRGRGRRKVRCGREEMNAAKMLPGLRLRAGSCIQELRIFAAASGNSARNATILFAGTDPFNLDETASSYFVSGDPVSGDCGLGDRIPGDVGLGTGSGWSHSVCYAIFSASEPTERSPSEPAGSNHAHGSGECAEGEGSAETGDPGARRAGLSRHPRQGDAGPRIQLLSRPPHQHGRAVLELFRVSRQAARRT